MASKIITRNDIIAFLDELEESLPLGKWKYGDIDIWPIIKIQVFSQCYHEKIVKKIPDKTLKISKLQQATNLLSSLKAFIGIFLNPKKKTDNIYCGASSHRVTHNGYFVNRYFQPLIEEEDTKSFLQLEYDKEQVDKRYQDPEKIIYLLELYPIFKLIRTFKHKPELYLPEWNVFEEKVSGKLDISLENYLLRLQTQCERLLTYIDIYSALFKKYKPRNVYGLCYYNLPMFAMHYTANKLGISNFDMQHGGQGSLHPMYRYKNVPIEGYNVLPQTFWCWDSASVHNIQKWLSSQSFHQVIKKGNPSIDYQINKSSIEMDLPDKHVILYTLQGKQLDSYILEAITETPDEYIWWIRLHPRMVNARKEIEIQLRSKGVMEKVEIGKATTYPLPLLLKASKVHISKFSGSIIEAAEVNTPTIIIDEVGVESYGKFIEEKMAVALLSKNASELVSAIVALTENKYFLNAKTRMIVASERCHGEMIFGLLVTKY